MKYYPQFTKIIMLRTLVTLISIGYNKYGNRINCFLTYYSTDLESLYYMVGKDHYSFSMKFKKPDLLNEDIIYLKPIALGLFQLMIMPCCQQTGC